jgi:hypothetical protein
MSTTTNRPSPEKADRERGRHFRDEAERRLARVMQTGKTIAWDEMRRGELSSALSWSVMLVEPRCGNTRSESGTCLSAPLSPWGSLGVRGRG